jgi:hypothetical protein
MWQLSYLLGDALHLLLLGFLLNWVFLGSFELWLSVRILTVVLLLLAITREHGGLMLLASLGVLIASEPASEIFTPNVQGMRYCLFALASVAYAYRFQSVRKAFSGSLADWLVPDSSEGGESGMDLDSQPRVLERGTSMIEKTLRWLVIAGISLLLAMFLLALAPYGELTSDRLLSRSLARGNTPVAGATLCIVVLAVLIIVREVGWRQHSAEQARLWLRSSFVMEHWPDLRMMVRRTMKLERSALNEEKADNVLDT